MEDKNKKNEKSTHKTKIFHVENRLKKKLRNQRPQIYNLLYKNIICNFI